MKKKYGILIPVIVLLTFVAMVTVNVLADILPINGVKTGEVSDAYPNLFTPAGFTFAIWGLIYALLAAYTLYQLGLFRGKGKAANEELLRKTGIVFSIINLVNIAWLFAWHYDLIAFSMVLMALLLVCLIVICMIIKAGSLSPREMFFVKLPFFVYFGWITVATIANASVLLVSLGWNGFGLSESFWTIMMLAVGALIGILTAIRFRSAAYGLVLVWAYAGILIKHVSANGYAGQYPGVIIAAIVCIVLLAAAAVYAFILKKMERL